MEMTKAFLDTSVLIGQILKLSTKAQRIFTDNSIEKYTNEYALKELYHVLKKKYGFTELEIAYAIDYIREICIILPNPITNEMKKINIRDRSDRPFVCSAMKYNLELYIDDMKTLTDAEKYVAVRRIPKD